MAEISTIRARYEYLQSARSPYLEAARRYSRYTVPDLLPPEGVNRARLPVPYASLPAQACLSLASKFLSTLFPASETWFVLNPSDKVQRDAAYKDSADMQEGLRRGLAQCTKAILQRVLEGKTRSTLSELFLNLVITGNGLIFQPDVGDLKFYSLDKYVCRRDGEDNPIEIITREAISYALLPEAVRQVIDSNRDDMDLETPPDYLDEKPEERSYPLYTRAIVRDGMWHVSQEVSGHTIDDGVTFPINSSPYIVLRLSRHTGEPYGTAYVANYFGYITADEALHYALRTGAAILAKIIYTVRRGGSTNINDIVNAANGAVIYGDGANEVATVTAGNKGVDMRIGYEYLDRIERALSIAFLMPTAAIRDSERTTAEEVSRTWEELEEQMASSFVLLAAEFQGPYLRCLLRIMQKTNAIPMFNQDLISPRIITGMTALARRSSMNRKLEFVRNVAGVMGPAAINTYIDVPAFLADVADDMQILAQGWLKSSADIAAEQQAQQQQAMTQTIISKGTAPIIQQGGQMLQKAANNQPVPIPE